MRIVLPVLLAASLSPSLAAEGFSDWTLWSPRDEIAPVAAVDARIDRGAGDGGGSLRLSGASNPGVFGGWHRLGNAVEPGQWYRLVAHYRIEGLGALAERQAIVVRLNWRRADGKRAGRPDYAHRIDDDGDWRRVTLDAQAPPDAAEAEIQLRLVYAPQATVWFDDVELEAIDAPEDRPVRVVAVNLRPRETGSAEASIERFAELAMEQAPVGADVILFPEGATVVGTGRTVIDVAESLPGPTTRRLGEVARAKSAYVVAGLYEREGSIVYNTAVLLDRQGRLVGKYRKVYLPREEQEAGLTPGADYPVFQTDFGRVGMMICWDVQYADPARALALRGAELLLMPIWGGNETLAAARAIENHVFLATSGYDHPTYVMDPTGERLSQAPADGTLADAVIDLNRRYEWQWLGKMRGRYFHELRRDVPVDPAQ